MKNTAVRLSTRVADSRLIYTALFDKDVVYGHKQMHGCGVPDLFLRQICPNGSGVKFRFTGLDTVSIETQIPCVKLDDRFLMIGEAAIILATREEHDFWIGPIHFNLEVFEIAKKP